MPIVSIEIVMPPGEQLEEGLAARLANRLGEVFGSPPGTTWVKLAAIPASRYAESGDGPPPGVFPVFVSILKSTFPEKNDLEGEIFRLTQIVAQACGRLVENVHLIYEPAASGRVAFGSKVVGR